MKMKRFVIILLCCVLIIFLKNPVYASDKFHLEMVNPLPISNNMYTDENISIKFSLDKKEGVLFRLQNQTNQYIKIDWNQIYLVDTKQYSHKIIHFGTHYYFKDALQSPTILPPIPNTKIDEGIYPADLWEHKVRFFGSKVVSKNFFDKKDINKVITIYMPLEIGGKFIPYTFELKIVKVSER